MVKEIMFTEDDWQRIRKWVNGLFKKQVKTKEKIIDEADKKSYRLLR